MKRTPKKFCWIIITAALQLFVAGCDRKQTPAAPRGQTAPGDSPIRVAGGSIIVHVKGKWVLSSGSTAFTTVSTTKISYTYIEIGGAFTPDPQSPSAPPSDAIWSNLPYWEIDIVDQNPNTSTEGITLCSNPNCTLSANTSSEVVLLKPIVGSMSSSFYTTDLSLSGRMFPGKRFYDSSLHSGTLDGSGGTDSPANTADIYERIKTITVKAPAQGATTPSTYIEDCPEGECFILIDETPSAAHRRPADKDRGQ
jgi:hypothetical protein